MFKPKHQMCDEYFNQVYKNILLEASNDRYLGAATWKEYQVWELLYICGAIERAYVSLERYNGDTMVWKITKHGLEILELL